jgi:cobalt-precorrin 5A hydrolase
LKIKSQPIITTATDINGLISIDEWANRNNVFIGDMNLAKKVSAHLVDGKSVGLSSDFEIKGEIPEEFFMNTNRDVGICISLDESKKPLRPTQISFPNSLFDSLQKGTRTEII